MKIYFYSENKDCKNFEKAVLLGEAGEVLDTIKSGVSAMFGSLEVGDFSGSALCLGDFDGVHKGHRALFSAAKAFGKWGVLIFDRNIKNAPLLTTQYEKIKLIEEFGADYLIIAEFSDAFLKRSPAEFVLLLKEKLGISLAVAGYDYRFGHLACGDAEALKKLCCDIGIKAEIVDEFADDTAAVKSTRIRDLIARGEIEKANELLGYSYFVSGTVKAGFKKGRTLGFPTANIAYDENKLLVQDGVYYGRAKGRDAVINVGKNPTFADRERTIEVHIPDFCADLYNEFIEVSFLEKIRDEKKFESEAELKAQVTADIRYVKEKRK